MTSVLIPRSDPAEELRTVAVKQFATTSYSGASLQQIADAAGYSKSSVLYHFASKEALLESALAPAVEKLGALLERSIDHISSVELRGAFVEEFIDFLLEYRWEAHIVINQGQSLAGIPTIDQAREYISRLSDSFMSELPTTQQRIRLGVALAGAAYILVAAVNDHDLIADESIDEVREALIAVVSELANPPLPSVSKT